MGIVHIKLHGMEKILNLTRWSVSAVDQVFALSTDEDLSGHGDFGALFVAYRRGSFVVVVENDGDGCLIDASLTLLVNQLGKTSSADLAKVGNAENKTDGVEDIRLP